MAFSSAEKFDLAILEGRHNAQSYTNALQNYLLPFAEENLGVNWMFQQDLTSVNTATIVKKWFLDDEVRAIEWPAKSPDLNRIENL